MKSQTLIILFIVGSFMLSCNKQNSYKLFSKFKNKSKLILTNTEITEYYETALLYYLDGYIVLTMTRGNKNQIHIYDTSFKYICSAALVGNGPGEVTNPFWGTIDKNSRIIWIHDQARQRLLKYPLDSILSDPNYRPNEFVKTPEKYRSLIAYQPFSDGLFSFLKTPKDDDLVSFFDKEAQVVDSMSIKDHVDIHNSYSIDPRKNFQSNYVYCQRPDNKMIAIAEKYSDILTIVDLSGKILAQVQGPDHITQIPDQSDSEQIRTNCVIKCNANHIFCLYLGKEETFLDRNLKEVVNYPNIIHVFNWNGDPVAEFELNEPIFSFNIDDSSKRLIAISSETGDLLHCKLSLDKR